MHKRLFEVANYESVVKNLKRRIQYDGRIFEKLSKSTFIIRVRRPQKLRNDEFHVDSDNFSNIRKERCPDEI